MSMFGSLNCTGAQIMEQFVYSKNILKTEKLVKQRKTIVLNI
jgi:hypothetical protein